jgi:O-antigen/teichoic acid export membrane protein
MHMKYELNSPAKSAGPLRKLAALIVTAALVGLVLMFSVVVLVIIAIVGAIAGIYLWWKTRELRKQMRNFSPREVAREEKVIEGEVIRTSWKK